MNICMVCMDFPPEARGIGNYVYNLSKNLIKNGHKVTVLTRGSWNKTRYENIENMDVYRVRFIPSYPFHLQVHGFFLNRLIKKIENDIDIFHIHNPLIPVIKTSKPIILTEHGTVKAGISNRKGLDPSTLGLKLFSNMYIKNEYKLLKISDLISAVSYSCSTELNRFYGLKDVNVMFNGVDIDFFIPDKTKKQEDIPLILYVGNLDSLKGLNDLIESANITTKYSSANFIIAGKGPLEKSLKKKIKSLNLETRFIFTGYLNKKDLLDTYQKSKVFVLPSYHEGFPSSILEAMSCELPVIATNVPGSSEIVKDGSTGFLVPPKSPKLLAKRMLQLLEEKELNSKMGKKARKIVVKKYNWGKITNEYDKIYNSIRGK